MSSERSRTTSRSSTATYDKFADAADFMAHATCPADAGGCALQTNVQSPESLDTHELVHAYLYPTGYPPWVLIEGAAVALSCTSRFYATSKPAMTWDQLASIQSGAVDPVSAYSAGAWLASYLLDQFGAAPFLEIYRSLSHDAGAADMTAAFQRIYGASLATLWASALSEDQTRNTCVWQCSRPPMALDGTAVDSDGTCGPDITRPFTLSSEATISFSTSSADISLGPCGPVTVPDGGLNGSLPGGLLALYHLQAGAYFLAQNPVPGTITGNGDASAVLNPTCALAQDNVGREARLAEGAERDHLGVARLRVPGVHPGPHARVNAVGADQAGPVLSIETC